MIGSIPAAGKGPFHMLTLHHERKNDVDIVVVDGVLNADSSQRVETLLESLITKECPNILVDAEKLTYISSAGVGCFIGVIKRIRDKKGDLRFSSATPPVQRVFNLLDLDEFFKFFPNLQEGVDSFE